MLPLQAVTPTALTEAVCGVPLEEARRIVGAIHRHDHLPAAVRNVRRTTLDRVRAAGTLPTLTVREVRCSRIDPFVKYSLESRDGEIVETVRIPLERHGRYSVCVSSQAGCGLGCAFCATSRLGLLRNLETWEIVEQVRVVRRGLNRVQGQRVHGIVFQGMGEPLANLDNVIESIRVACEPSGLAVDGRAITVCTAGLPAGIRRLAREVPAIRLAISIASPIPAVRGRLMPIDRAFLSKRSWTRQSSTPGSRGWLRCGPSHSSMASTTPAMMRANSPHSPLTSHEGAALDPASASFHSIPSILQGRRALFAPVITAKKHSGKCSGKPVYLRTNATAEAPTFWAPADSWPGNTRTFDNRNPESPSPKGWLCCPQRAAKAVFGAEDNRCRSGCFADCPTSISMLGWIGGRIPDTSRP